MLTYPSHKHFSSWVGGRNIGNAHLCNDSERKRHIMVQKPRWRWSYRPHVQFIRLLPAVGNSIFRHVYWSPGPERLPGVPTTREYGEQSVWSELPDMFIRCSCPSEVVCFTSVAAFKQSPSSFGAVWNSEWLSAIESGRRGILHWTLTIDHHVRSPPSVLISSKTHLVCKIKTAQAIGKSYIRFKRGKINF